MRSEIVKLHWDEEIGFLGYTVGNDSGLYSSITTLPPAAKEEAARLVLDLDQTERSRATEASMQDKEFRPNPRTFMYSPHLLPELDHAREIMDAAEDDRSQGRPTQAFCTKGHAMRAAYVRANGKRDCRLCKADRERDRRARNRAVVG